MQILERGELPEEKVYTMRCYKCKSLFTFLRHEALRYSAYRNETYLEVKCPVCNNIGALEI